MNTIQYVNRLAFCNQILKEKRNNELRDQIIKKYEEGTIKTEKLRNDLFSFRLNDTQRVISTIILQDKKNTLLILELLPHHEYSKSKYLNNPIDLDNFSQGYDYTIVDNLREFSVGKSEIDSLPKLGFVRHHETTLLLNRDQLAVLEGDEKQSIIKVTGAAGSGKTLMAELLIKQNQKQNHKILYVTQSKNLVAEVNEHCNKERNADIKTFESLCENILEGKALKVKDHFIQWAKKNTKKNPIIDSFTVKGNLDDNITRELYEDICKVHDSDGDSELGKKSLHYDENTIKELYTLYLKQLDTNANIDLSLHRYPDNNPLNQYDIILVDESQDFGMGQLQYIKHFLNNNGCIYFFIDTNQSLSSDFNLIEKYIYKLDSLPNGIKNYQLNTGYRTPKHVTDLLNKITEVKRKIIGGRLNPDTLKIKTIQDNNPGNIYWLHHQKNNIENNNIVEKLRKDSETSIQIAFIVPDESVIECAKNLFPKGAIYTPETIKGLEFKKIVLVDFLTKKNSGLNAAQLDVDKSEQDKVNFPKTTEKTKYSRFFNQLFVSASRTTYSLYFIHTEPDQISEKLNKLFNVDVNPNYSEDLLLSDSTPEETIQFIMNNKNQLDLSKLVYYCEKFCEKIQSPVNDDLSKSLKSIKEILSNRNTKKVDNQQQEILTSLIKRVDLLLEKSQPLALLSVDTHETIKISSSMPMTDPLQDKRLCLEDLKNINLLTIHEKQLEQTINDSGKTVLLSLLVIRQDLPDIFNNPQYLSSFAKKITEKSLNQQDKNGICALYYLVKNKNLKTIFNKMTQDITFIEKIDKDNFEKIISTGWSPFLLLFLNNKKTSKHLKKYKKDCLELEHLKEILSNIHTDDFFPLFYFSKRGDNKVINYLIDKGIDINFSDKTGVTALHLATEQGHLTTVEFLVDKGADINFFTLDRSTVLHIAALKGHLKIVEFLVDKGADINFSNNNGVTALHIATERGHLTTVAFLVDKGADINITNNNGFTALHLAIEENKLEIIDFLFSREEVDINIATHDGLTALQIAAEQGNLKSIKILLSRGVNINLANKGKQTALRYAAMAGQLAVVECLVNNKADINLAANDGTTALLCAAMKGHLAVVECLVNNKADINLAANDGTTALQYAAMTGHLAVVEFIVNNKADINLANNSGETALHIAAPTGDLKIVEFLVNNGADIKLANNNGNTALQCASHKKVVDFLTKQCQKQGEPANLDQITYSISSFSGRQTDTTIMALNDNSVSTPIAPLHRGEPLNPRGL